MKKIHYTFVVVCVLVIGVTMVPLGVASPTPATATVYVNPSTITTTAGINYTVEVRVENVVDLYGWDIGLRWDPSALECLKFEEGPFLKKDGVSTYGLLFGIINNAAGEIHPSFSNSRQYDPGNPASMYGVNGSGTLANVTFRAKKTGTFSVHPWGVTLGDSEPKTIKINVVDIFPVVWDGGVYPVVIVNNLTGAYEEIRSGIFDHVFNQTAMKISFNVTGPTDVFFYNITIPNALLRANATHPWTILLDGMNITADTTITENDTHTFIYFEHTLSTQGEPVAVIGTEVIPEFPAAMIVPLLIVAALVATVLGKKK